MGGEALVKALKIKCIIFKENNDNPYEINNIYIKLIKGIWQYIFLLFHCKELLKLYVNLLYRFCVTILFLEIF